MPWGSDFRQRLLQIGNDVIDIFDADGKTHHFRPGASGDALLVRQLTVRGGGRMDDQRARIADIGEVREQFEGLDKLDAGLVATLQAESEDRACTLGRIFLLQGMVLVVREARIGYPGNLRVLFQPCRDGRCIVAVTLHPERQGFKPREDEEGVERRNRRTQVAQAKYACCDGEGEIAEGLVKDHAAIVRPRLRQKRILARLRPVEGAAVNNDAADGIAMAADELGKRMDDYVCAMLYRADEVG